MLPDLSALSLRAAPTDGIVVLEAGDRRRFDDDEKKIPRLDPVDLEPIPANVELFEMPVDPNRPEGVIDYLNPATVWSAALANPLKAPLRPLLLEEWEELKARYGDAASDEDKRKMRRAERCLERHWASEPGENVVCGSEDGSGSEDDEDVATTPEERFEILRRKDDPAVLAAGSLQDGGLKKLNEWYLQVALLQAHLAALDAADAAASRSALEEPIRQLIKEDAERRGTLPRAWPHPAMLREVQEAWEWIIAHAQVDDQSLPDESMSDSDDISEPDDPNDPEAWYDLQADDENFVVQSFDGWEAFLRATWRLLPGLPESAVNGAVVRAVLDAAQTRGIYNYVRGPTNLFSNEEIVSTVREALNDLITLFPYLWEQVYSMAKTAAERLNVAEASLRAASEAERSEESWAEEMRARRDRLRGEAGAAGAAGPSSSLSAAGSSSAAPGARRRAFDERGEASETQQERQRRRRSDDEAR